MKKICTPFIPKTSDEAIKFFKEASKHSPDIIELWLDHIPLEEIDKIISQKPCPVLVVCKAETEKGSFIGSEKDRILKLMRAVSSGCDYVDIGYHTDEKLIDEVREIIFQKSKKDKIKAKLIISYHNWDETPKLTTMLSGVNRLQKLNPDIIKYITTARNEYSSIQMYRLCGKLSQKNIPFISFVMGDKASASRVICPLLGSEWTYCPLNKSYSTAPGQIDIESMKSIWEKL